MSQDTTSTEWIPVLADTTGPRYLAFVQSLESDIESGALKPGTRLLPQRDMAAQLGLSVGTISRAYAEAETRGLISGEVGRGTFVQRRRHHAQHTNGGPAATTVNLALNVPPSTGEDELIASVLEDIVADRCVEAAARLPAASGTSPSSQRHGRMARRNSASRPMSITCSSPMAASMRCPLRSTWWLHRMTRC